MIIANRHVVHGSNAQMPHDRLGEELRLCSALSVCRGERFVGS
jgi:hypothetical protein